MINTIIFDGFGTLIATENTSVDSIKSILSHNNRNDIDAFEFYTVFKAFHRNNIANSLGDNFITEEASFTLALKDTFLHYNINGNAETDIKYMLDILGKRALFEDTKEVIEALTEDFNVFIGSNTDTAPLKEILKRNRLLVSGIYTSEMLRVYKPNPLFYKKILDNLNIAPNEAIFVGDSIENDVIAPERIGIFSCHINRNDAFYESFKPKYSISSLYDLPTLLKELNKGF